MSIVAALFREPRSAAARRSGSIFFMARIGSESLLATGFAASGKRCEEEGSGRGGGLSPTTGGLGRIIEPGEPAPGETWVGLLFGFPRGVASASVGAGAPKGGEAVPPLRVFFAELRLRTIPPLDGAMLVGPRLVERPIGRPALGDRGGVFGT